MHAIHGPRSQHRGKDKAERTLEDKALCSRAAADTVVARLARARLDGLAELVNKAIPDVGSDVDILAGRVRRDARLQAPGTTDRLTITKLEGRPAFTGGRLAGAEVEAHTTTDLSTDGLEYRFHLFGAALDVRELARQVFVVDVDREGHISPPGTARGCCP